MFHRIFMDGHNTAHGARFLLAFGMYPMLAETDQVCLILVFALMCNRYPICSCLWAQRRS